MKKVDRNVVAVVTFVLCATSVLLGAQTDLAGVSGSIRAALSVPEPESEPVPALFVDVGQVVQQPAGPPPTPRHTGVRALVKGLVSDVKHLPSKENLFWVAVGSGLALAVHPLDDNVNRGLVGSENVRITAAEAHSPLATRPTRLRSLQRSSVISDGGSPDQRTCLRRTSLSRAYPPIAIG